MTITSRPTLEDLENSTGQLPVVGYSVQWNLNNLEISHTGLVNALLTHGFGAFRPEPVSPTIALRRALVRWVQGRAAAGAAPVLSGSGLEDMENDESTNGSGSAAQKSLIRKLNSPRSDWLVFSLVIENPDLEALGLSYATRLRVLLHKKTSAIRVTASSTGQVEDANPVEDRENSGGAGDEHSALSAGEPDNETQALAEAGKEIRRLWRYFREHHLAADLSILLRQVIGSLDSFALRRQGGVYFVPQSREAGLRELRRLVEAFPPAPGRTGDRFFLALPVLDGREARRQLAGAAHRDFMEELQAMQADLSRLVSESEEHKLRPATLSRRLADYSRLKLRAGVYAELLDMRHDNITALLNALTTQAQNLLDRLTDEEEEDGALPGKQQAFDWESAEDVHTPTNEA